jgi:protein-S-isoprenylcysteine O-methyltransferase Ste14
VASSETPYLAHKAAFYAVSACWCAFVLTFGLMKRPSAVRETKRDRTSLIGMSVQGVAFLVLWFNPLQRKQLSQVTSGSAAVEWGVTALAVVMAIFSVWMVHSAARRLGKQWALTARIVEGHELVQDGPYRLVRNPIYTGMFGMLLATGMVIDRGIPLAIAIVVFLAGTYIRIQSEERLLRQVFGSEFEAYARKVPALIPGIY